MPSMIPFGNVRGMAAVALTLSPVAVAAATSAEQTFPLPGVLPGDFVHVSKPTAQAGIGLAGVRVSAVDQIAITFINATAASVTPTAAQVYQVLVFRPDGTPNGHATF
ncbi:MAG TPA: hypothetical protein VL424_14335 [Pararobbsia sp.]|jgi:hypothetical protein|nr:hypothetical protein [Pararobbsia sp.]